ncbi:MAG: hypothetical protein WCI11_09210 [Candidatus Methylumidiphilus sp.]
MKVEELESEVSQLSTQELKRFSQWFEEFKADQWDKQIEEDILAGRLDALGEEALRDLREGRCTDL